MDVYGLRIPELGDKTCSQVFEEAGCDTPASPSCGACLGGPRDTYARMNEPMVSIFCHFLAQKTGMVLYKPCMTLLWPYFFYPRGCLNSRYRFVFSFLNKNNC
jgi:hypothetical protein